MSVDCEIMPDIPEDKRGLHHWATPEWISVHKRCQTKCEIVGGNPVPVTIKPRRGPSIRFKSVAACAAKFKITRPNMSTRLTRARSRKDKKIRLAGKYYTLIEGEL